MSVFTCKVLGIVNFYEQCAFFITKFYAKLFKKYNLVNQRDFYLLLFIYYYFLFI